MILISLGANLPSSFGSPLETLRAVLPELEKAGIKIIASSNVWLTAPVPVSDQPDYHNAVIAVETEKTPSELLAALQQVEQAFGRVRHLRNEARVLDLDLIAYDDLVIDQAELIVPHPRMHQRAFVLLPLQEIAPDWVHPVLQQSTDNLIMVLPTDQIARRLPEALS